MCVAHDGDGVHAGRGRIKPDGGAVAAGANVTTIQAFEGTAIAIAMSGSALPDNKRFAITTNWGNFRGTKAASLVAQMRLSDNVVANAGFATGFQYGGLGSRAGVLRVVAGDKAAGYCRLLKPAQTGGAMVQQRSG